MNRQIGEVAMENKECDKIADRINGNNCLDTNPESIQTIIRTINHAIHDGNLDSAFRLLTGVLDIGLTSLRQTLEANPLELKMVHQSGNALLDVAADLVIRLKVRGWDENDTNVLFRFAKAAEIQRLALEFAKTVLGCTHHRVVKLEYGQSSLLRELAKAIGPIEKRHEEIRSRIGSVDYYVSTFQTHTIIQLAYQVGAALDPDLNGLLELAVPLRGEFSEDAPLMREGGKVHTFVNLHGTYSTGEYEKVCKLTGSWTLNLPYDSSRSPDEYVEMWTKYIRMEKHSSLCQAIADHLLVKLKANLVPAFIDKAFEENQYQPIHLHFTMPLPASRFDSAYCYLTFFLNLQLLDKDS